MNRVIYSSVQIIPFGWGLHKKAKNEYDYHSLIRRTKVIIQKKILSFEKNVNTILLLLIQTFKRAYRMGRCPLLIFRLAEKVKKK